MDNGYRPQRPTCILEIQHSMHVCSVGGRGARARKCPSAYMRARRRALTTHRRLTVLRCRHLHIDPMHRFGEWEGQKQTTACVSGLQVVRGHRGQKKCQHPLVKNGPPHGLPGNSGQHIAPERSKGNAKGHCVPSMASGTGIRPLGRPWWAQQLKQAILQQDTPL